MRRLITHQNRAEILAAVAAAPIGAQIELVEDVRSLAQNRLMWRLLSRLADQIEHCGEHWEPEDFKAAFLKMMGKKLRFMPALDGGGVVAIGYRSSQLSKAEMSEMIERIYEYGARHGVEFDDPPRRRVA